MPAIPIRPPGKPEEYDEKIVYQELLRCSDTDADSPFGVSYFLKNYVKIYNNDSKKYVPFDVWDTPVEPKYDNQRSMLRKMQVYNRIIALKSRQIGATTLVLGYFLYEMLFNPTAFVLLLSRGELEAKELLLRLKTMYKFLPPWMKSETVGADSKTEWRLSSGSVALSLSSHRGDSYSSTHCLIDEGALLYRANISLNQVLLNLAPTTGQHGKLFIISKADKSRPQSTFNNIYTNALAGKSEYKACFIPYNVVPGRDKEWYDKQVETSKSIDGTMDFCFETYPATPQEALAPKSSDKRLAYTWLEQCYEEIDPIIVVGDGKSHDDNEDIPEGVPDVPGLTIYKMPQPGYIYIISADPSEGLATSDPASITVMELTQMEEVASFAKPAEVGVFGSYIDKIAHFYNKADILFELNQHGHGLKLWLQENCKLRLLKGWAKTEGMKKIGWEQSSVTKGLMYDTTAEELQNGRCIIHDPVTHAELSSIESSTLKAPKGMNDDQATTFALAIAGIKLCKRLTRIDFLTLKG